MIAAVLFLFGAFAGVPVDGRAAKPSPAESPATARTLDAMAVREGGTVCEIGAGSGEMSIAAARRVGPAGRVLASELGDSRIAILRGKVAESGLPHITVVAGDAAKTNFAQAGCDSVLLRDVYHHLSDPLAMSRSIAAALKPGGRVVVVDFTPPGEEAANPAERAKDGRHGVTPDTVSREMRSAGLELVSVERSAERSAERWFMVVLARPSLPAQPAAR